MRGGEAGSPLSRLCENALKRELLGIVFSVVRSRWTLAEFPTFESSKSRRKFYLAKEHQSFHKACFAGRADDGTDSISSKSTLAQLESGFLVQMCQVSPSAPAEAGAHSQERAESCFDLIWFLSVQIDAAALHLSPEGPLFRSDLSPPAGPLRGEVKSDFVTLIEICSRRSTMSNRVKGSLHRSRREEFDEMIVDLVGRFLLQVVAGRERLGIDEVARIFAPHRGILLGRRRPSRSP
jgi:hypothetical protein